MTQRRASVSAVWGFAPDFGHGWRLGCRLIGRFIGRFGRLGSRLGGRFRRFGRRLRLGHGLAFLLFFRGGGDRPRLGEQPPHQERVPEQDRHGKDDEPNEIDAGHSRLGTFFHALATYWLTMASGEAARHRPEAKTFIIERVGPVCQVGERGTGVLAKARASTMRSVVPGRGKRPAVVACGPPHAMRGLFGGSTAPCHPLPPVAQPVAEEIVQLRHGVNLLRWSSRKDTPPGGTVPSSSSMIA